VLVDLRDTADAIGQSLCIRMGQLDTSEACGPEWWLAPAHLYHHQPLLGTGRAMADGPLDDFVEPPARLSADDHHEHRGVLECHHDLVAGRTTGRQVVDHRPDPAPPSEQHPIYVRDPIFIRSVAKQRDVEWHDWRAE